MLHAHSHMWRRRGDKLTRFVKHVLTRIYLNLVCPQMIVLLSSESLLLYRHCRTMHECPPRPVRRNITNLPPEIIVDILSKLADLDSLLSTIQSCRYLYRSFKDQYDGGRAVIESIFARILLLEPTPEKVCNAITFAVHHNCVPYVAANSLFWRAWNFFRDRIPEMPDSDVSWSYAVICLPPDAQRLLVDIANGRRLTERSSLSAKNYKSHRQSKTERIKPLFDLILLGRIFMKLTLMGTWRPLLLMACSDVREMTWDGHRNILQC